MYNAKIKKNDYDENLVNITIYDNDNPPNELVTMEEITFHQLKHGPDMKEGRNWDGDSDSHFVERWFVLYKKNEDGTAGEQIKFVDSTEGGKRRKRKTRKK